jgi:predicted negative regulator of RcsB-dependent stress response
MTFTKYVALMLLGFALFVGYQAYVKHEAQHERCTALYGDYVGSIGSDRVTGSELNGKYAKYNELCPGDWKTR